MSFTGATYEAIRSVGGDPADEPWFWLLSTGPHGLEFTWSQTKRNPPGYVGIVHLQQVIEALEPVFRERLRRAIGKALTTQDVILLRNAIQVGAAIGGPDELCQILALTKHPDGSVASDAKAGHFYLKKRLRGTAT